MAEKTRTRVIISGRVQGVFFRQETQKFAAINNIKGWVKNRFDGTVEAMFEGDSEDVKRIVKWCWRGSPASSVERVDIFEETYIGDFTDFAITYER
jgi:acylphosphatase